jgi:chromosome segregation ATPase
LQPIFTTHIYVLYFYLPHFHHRENMLQQMARARESTRVLEAQRSEVVKNWEKASKDIAELEEALTKRSEEVHTYTHIHIFILNPFIYIIH